MKRWLPIVTTLLFACSGGAMEDPPESFEEGPLLVTADGKGDELAQDIPAYDPLPSGAVLDGEFEALFAPDDAVNTIEMELIRQTVDARAADDRDFVEGENPYRIRYAAYNLRNPRIVEALADAEEDGVDVQVLIDADQLDPERTWNIADERLIERGFEFHPDHREIDGDDYTTGDLIGIGGGGLMHLKARIFETPSGRRVLSGSMNPGDHAVMNEETLHLITGDHLVSRYVAAYDTILYDEDFQNEWRDDEPVNVMFTPASGDRAVERVFDWVAAEDEQILLMVFSLRDLRAPNHDRSLVELLGDKVDAGVPVYVITDRKQSDGVDADGNRIMRNDDTEDELRAAGVHVFEATNRATPFTAMHHKAAVLGRTNIKVITDAANWTFSGLGSDTRSARNIESQLFIDSAALDDNRTGRRYLAQWMRVASRYAEQSADDGEPDFPEIRETLTGAEDWPGQPVWFTAHEATTEFGQSVYVRGDRSELGAWGESNDGHELTTDEANYPMWTSPAAAMLPLGYTFEWKFVIGFPGDSEVVWESGDNRRGFVQPTALLPTRGSLHEGVWR